MVRAPSDRSDSSVVRRREIVRASPVVSKPAKLTTGAQAQEGFQKFKCSQTEVKMQRGRPCSSTWRVALAFLMGVAAVNGLCGENQHVRGDHSYGFACYDCPSNTVRVAGDDPAAGYGTYCTCPAGYTISKYSYGVGCRPCPANSTSTAQRCWLAYSTSSLLLQGKLPCGL